MENSKLENLRVESSKVDVTFLGTASGLPTEARQGQTIVVTVTHAGKPSHILLDTGDGASSFLARAGFDHRLIQTIFISHMHADHHGGFAQVVKTSMHLGKKDELVVLAPEEGIPALQAYLRASYLYDDQLGFEIRWIPLSGCVNRAVQLPCGSMLEAVTNHHLDPVKKRMERANAQAMKHHAFESYSAVLCHGDLRIIYSGNLNKTRDWEELGTYVEPCALFIAELAHVEPVRLGEFLDGRHVGHTAVTHFHPRWDSVYDAEIDALIRNAATSRGLQGGVTLARDGTVLDVLGSYHVAVRR